MGCVSIIHTLDILSTEYSILRSLVVWFLKWSGKTNELYNCERAFLSIQMKDKDSKRKDKKQKGPIGKGIKSGTWVIIIFMEYFKNLSP